MLSRMAGILKANDAFDLAATFHDADTAYGQSSVFRPTLFLLDVDEPGAVELIPRFIKSYPQAQILGLMGQWKSCGRKAMLSAGLVAVF